MPGLRSETRYLSTFLERYVLVVKLPSALASLESLVSIKEQGGLTYFRLAQFLGWTLEHPNALLIAALIEPKEPEDDWLEQVALWLASTPAALDDSLQVAEDGIWLVRRHMPAVESVQLEASLSQLFSLARWFTCADKSPSETAAHTFRGQLA